MSKKLYPQSRPKVNIGLVNINNSFSGQNYLPYSVACLQAYAEKNIKNLKDFEFRLPLYKRISVEKSVKILMGNNIVFFSTYVWNFRISLEIARVLKQQDPKVLIVFGGPQIPDHSENFLREAPFVDFVCHGEGEHAFLLFLENYVDNAWHNVSSLSYLNHEGQFIENKKSERIKDLSTIPSPYLSGTFDRLMQANPQEEWIVLWETNRGCPFACTFCDWGSAIASKVHKFDIERIYMEIDWFSKNRIEFIYCCDANFGIFPRDLDIVQYMAKTKKEFNFPKAFSVQNTKNSTDKSYNIQKLMGESGLNKGVTLSLQSIDSETLKNVKRANIKSDVFRELQQRFTKEGVETYTDMILALAGETYDSFVNGISSVIESGQHNRIQFNNLSILPNAEMGNLEYQKKYGFVVCETDIINIHGSLAETEEIQERQQLVVGTSSMPPEAWRSVRVFCWMTSLLHFDKVLQIPLILLNSICSLSYRELIESFTRKNPNYPILTEILEFFEAKALDIQRGGAEYSESKKWLNIWWPTDELLLIRLCTENKLDLFYEEVESLLLSFLERKGIQFPEYLLQESLKLNRQLIKLPKQDMAVDIKLSFNIYDFYRAALQGVVIPLKEGGFYYRVNRTTDKWFTWDDWCREVIWYGNKKGAYLYECESISDKKMRPQCF